MGVLALGVPAMYKLTHDIRAGDTEDSGRDLFLVVVLGVALSVTALFWTAVLAYAVLREED